MALLNTTELNLIISSINKDTSIFQNCNVFDKSITESFLINPVNINKESSASLTDLVKAELSTDHSNIFLKIWINWLDLVEEDIKNKTHVISNGITELEDFNLLSRITSDPGYIFTADVSDPKTTKGLAYEAKVYQFVTDNIILKNISPNFIPLLLNKKCPVKTIVASLGTDPSYGKMELTQKLKTLLMPFPNLSLSFVMTGSSDMMVSLKEFARDFFKTTEEYLSVIFQYMHALYIMGKYKIQHNDNHFDNTLVQVLASPVILHFKILHNQVKFRTKYIVKFFDWDRAYVEGLGNNPFLDNMHFVRQINSFIPNRDFYQFLCYAFTYVPSTKLTTILKKKIREYPYIKENNFGTDIRVLSGVNDRLLEWISLHPENVMVDTDGEQYVTISKTDFIRLVNRIAVAYVSSTLDKYWTKIKTLYFKIDGTSIILLKGYGCMPLYDLDSPNIDGYFENIGMFEPLCEGLDVVPDDVETPFVYQFPVSVPEVDIPPPSYPGMAMRDDPNPQLEPESESEPEPESDSGSDKAYVLPKMITLNDDNTLRHIFNYSVNAFSKIKSVNDIRPSFQFVTDNFQLNSDIFFMIVLVLLKNISSLFSTTSNYIYFSFDFIKWIISSGYEFTSDEFSDLMIFLYNVFPNINTYAKLFQKVFMYSFQETNAIIRKIVALSSDRSQHIDNLFERYRSLSRPQLYGNDLIPVQVSDQDS